MPVSNPTAAATATKVSLALLLFAVAASDAPQRPVTIGHEPDLDACLSLSQIQGAKSGMVSVRSAPDANSKEIDRLDNGDFVYDCDEAGEWAGVVYMHGEQTPDCGVSSPVAKEQAYTGPCRSGWVRRKWVIVVAG